MIKMTTMYSMRITSFPRKTYARSEALTAYRFGNATVRLAPHVNYIGGILFSQYFTVCFCKGDRGKAFLRI